MGCLYLLDIRIDGPTVAFGLNEFQWIHCGLFAVAACMGAIASAAERALLACAVMILSEMAGIFIWVGYILRTEPNNNLWPLGLILFSACGTIVVSLGVLIGYLAAKSLKKKHSNNMGNSSV
jgi:hypothetical protein